MLTEAEQSPVLTLSKVARYVKEKHGLNISRMTPYNWAKIGIRGEKLKAGRAGWKILATKAAVEDFLIRTGLAGGRVSLS